MISSCSNSRKAARLQVLGQPPGKPASRHSRKGRTDKVTGKLVLENLKHKPMRSLLSFLLIGVPVTLILSWWASATACWRIRSAARAASAPTSSSGRPAPRSSRLSGGRITSKMVDWFARQPHVKMAMGVVNQPVRTSRSAPPASTWTSSTG